MTTKTIAAFVLATLISISSYSQHTWPVWRYDLFGFSQLLFK